MTAAYSITAETELLDLELSHDDNSDDVSKPVQNNEQLFPPFQNVALNDDRQPMLSNNDLIDDNKSNNEPLSLLNTQKLLEIGTGMVARSMADSITSSMMNSTSNQNMNDVQSMENAGTVHDKVYKCWQIEYYRMYFDIDTTLEMKRLRRAMFPFISGPFFDSELNEKPDLYGPFWAASTLAFLMAAMGNLARFLNREESNSQQWDGDIAKMTEAATFLYSGGIIVPAVIYLVLRAYEVTDMGFIHLISLYGYSLVPFIPACIFCVAPWNFFDWTVVFVSMITSILLLIKNIYLPLVEEKKRKPGWYLVGIICVCQFALSLALKLYFFKY